MPDGSPAPFRFAPGRGPAVAARAMAATSQPTATLAALDTMRAGGNAADAAIAAAAVLCVAEPFSTGIGGDAFALVWDGGAAHALDAAGAAPLGAAPQPVAPHGPRSVNTPAAVRGWGALSERFGRLGLDRCLAPAIDLAEHGVAAGFNCAANWAARADRAPREFGPPPRLGQVFRLPELGASLRAIADDGPDALYTGRIADAIVSASWLEHEDLAACAARWVEPLSVDYRGVRVLELPPPTQGVAVLEALALLEQMPAATASRVTAVALALEDAFARVRDGADVGDLLDPARIAARRAETPKLRREPPGGTVYLCVVDEDGMAVSFIQSLFEPFGSGVVAPGTGIALNNRAACFAVSGAIEPGRRSYHTLVPGMLLQGDALLGPFGVMGGFIQAQAHVQLVSALVDDGLDPQAALDRPRFRIEDDAVRLEEGLWPSTDELRDAGFAATRDDGRFAFGGGQAILARDGTLLGGSDPRKDGFAAGF